MIPNITTATTYPNKVLSLKQLASLFPQDVAWPGPGFQRAEQCTKELGISLDD